MVIGLIILIFGVLCTSLEIILLSVTRVPYIFLLGNLNDGHYISHSVAALLF